MPLCVGLSLGRPQVCVCSNLPTAVHLDGLLLVLGSLHPRQKPQPPHQPHPHLPSPHHTEHSTHTQDPCQQQQQPPGNHNSSDIHSNGVCTPELGPSAKPNTRHRLSTSGQHAAPTHPSNLGTLSLPTHRASNASAPLPGYRYSNDAGSRTDPVHAHGNQFQQQQHPQSQLQSQQQQQQQRGVSDGASSPRIPSTNDLTTSGPPQQRQQRSSSSSLTSLLDPSVLSATAALMAKGHPGVCPCVGVTCQALRGLPEVWKVWSTVIGL